MALPTAQYEAMHIDNRQPEKHVDEDHWNAAYEGQAKGIFNRHTTTTFFVAPICSVPALFADCGSRFQRSPA
jgi:hypothetical protein